MTAAADISASVRRQILNRSRKENRPFAELLHYFMMERFLYRLSRSPYAERFILKGALMLQVWRVESSRSTMDIDLLGITENSESSILKLFGEILTIPLEPDGVFFDPETLGAETIREAADYTGLRVRFLGYLGTARVTMQVDIGFGDVVYPGPELLEMPTVIDLPAPRIYGYSRESVIAEKLEAMAVLGSINSRIKDFYDIWIISRCFNFEEKRLAEAIGRTFSKRGTSLQQNGFPPLTEAFARDKQLLWNAFRKRLGRMEDPESFLTIIEHLRTFIEPIIPPLLSRSPLRRTWIAPGPWK